MVPRLHRRSPSLFSVALICLAAAAAPREDEARVARLARGDVPLQQPAARRALPDDPLGRRLARSSPRRSAASRVVVGRPYYDFFLRVFGLPLLLLMGIGPLIAWRRASLRGLARVFAWPVGVALVDRGRCLIALGAGSSIPGLIAYTFSAFVLATIVLEFVAGRGATRADRRVVPARSGSSSRATGGATAATSSTRRSCCSRSASPARAPTTRSSRGGSRRGESLDGRATTRSRYRALDRARGRERDGDPRACSTSARRRRLGTLQRRQERLQRRAAGLERGRDPHRLADRRGSVRDRRAGRRETAPSFFRVFVKPLVNLIWLAGLVFVLGSLIALWPDAREERRLATRYARRATPT